MKVLVIGLGSMGKRRIRLLKEHFKEVLIVGVDTNEKRVRDVRETMGIACETSIEDAKSKGEIDCAFICTSPLSHADIIKLCLENNWNIFSEINLTDDGYLENIELAERKKRLLFLSSTPLYQGEMKAIHELVSKGEKPIRYVYHVGQYLPDWHPWERYQDFFIGRKRTNGCREIFEIELPWMMHSFGAVKSVRASSSKITSLEIDYHDNYFVELQHENGNAGIFIVDVVAREPVRRLEIYSEDLYIEWNGTPESLKYKNFDSGEIEILPSGKYVNLDGYSQHINEDSYLNELIEFFDVLSGKKTAVYDFRDDFRTLRLIDEIEGGM